MLCQIGRLAVAAARLEEWIEALEAEVIGPSSDKRGPISASVSRVKKHLEAQSTPTPLERDMLGWLTQAQDALTKRNRVLHARWLPVPDELKQKWELLGTHEESGTPTPSTVDAMYDLAMEVLDASLVGEHYTLLWRASHPR